MNGRAAKRKSSGARRDSSNATPGLLELDYHLAELPSAQHRAGLAGLVLMLRFMERQPKPKAGICRLTRVDELGASIEIDLDGLKWLFDEVYAATNEELREGKLRKHPRTKEAIRPLREEVTEIPDPEGPKKKRKAKTYYIYPVVVPRASLLLELDPTRKDNAGAWVKLFRDMVWSILRGVPATRQPFEARAAAESTDDADRVWAGLIKPADHSIDLPSTYFLGAQATTAEDVPFRDRARLQLLLHLWPYVAQIYEPVVVDATDATRKSLGFAIAVPDVARLATFCSQFAPMLRARGTEMARFRPRECFVDLAIEAALDTARRLRQRVAAREGDRATTDLVLGIEVFHVAKEGNSIRLLSNARVDVEPQMVDTYERLRDTLIDRVFRRARLVNLVNHRPWHAGFDTVAQTLPHKTHTIGSPSFRHDARSSFKFLVKDEETMDPESRDTTTSIDALVYKLVRSYVLGKLETKYQLTWKGVEGNPSREKDFNETRGDVARKAFLAVRGRTGADFVDYFAGTICSTFRHLPQEQFGALAQALRADPISVRQLTLLALSANG